MRVSRPAKFHAVDTCVARAADSRPGAPEQLTLMPTVSLGAKNEFHESRASVDPVRPRMPWAIMSCTTGTLILLVAVSIDCSALTRTTDPEYFPGMPGDAAGWKRDTTLYFGRSGRISAEDVAG